MVVWLEGYSIIPCKFLNLLLKVVIQESHMDTNATTLQIGFHLSSLNNFMVSCEHDIMKFNGNSKVLMYSINSRGETKKSPHGHIQRVFCMQ